MIRSALPAFPLPRSSGALVLLLVAATLVMTGCAPAPDPELAQVVVDYGGVPPEGARVSLGKGAPTVLALTDDGQSLALGSNVGLYMFDAHSLEELWSLPSDRPVTAAAFSDDGELLAAGLEDGTIFLVDAGSGRIINRTDGGGTASVQSLAWQGAGEAGTQLLVSGYNDGNIALSSVNRDEAAISVVPAGVLGRAFTGVSALAFSPNRRILVTGNRSGVIQFWDTESMVLIGDMEGHQPRQPIQTLRWSPKGDILYSGGDDGQVIVWDILEFRPSQIIDGQSGGILAIDPSDDDGAVSAVGVDGVYSAWAINSGSSRVSLDSAVGSLKTAAISEDGKTFAGVTEEGLLHVWNINSDSLSPAATLEGFSGDNSWARAVSWHPEENLLATNMWNKIIIWDPEQQARLQTLEGHTGLVTSLAYSPDGDRLASAGRDMSVHIWDAKSGDRLQTLSGHTASVTAVAWSPDGSLLASVGSLDNQVIVWDVDSGEIIETMLGPNEAVWSVGWSPDGSTLAVGTMSGEVVLWNTEDLSEYDVEVFLAHLSWVSDVAWSPDGTRLATAGADAFATIWDVEDGRRLKTLAGHAGPVTSLAFSPDGALLGTSSVDQLVIAWDIAGESATPGPLHIFSGHADEVDAVHWSPRGSALASASRDGTVILWEPGGEISR